MPHTLTHTHRQTDRDSGRSSSAVATSCGRSVVFSPFLSCCCCCHLRHNYATFVCSTVWDRGGSGQLGAWPSLALLRLKRFTHFKRNLHLPLCFQYQHCSLFLSHSLTHSLSVCLSFSRTAEGAFKKLKPEPNSGLSTVSAGITSPGSGLSSLSQHAGHTPTTASCPTPARRRHRTTFTQVSTPPPLPL